MQAFKKFLLREIVFTISVGVISYILFSTIFKNYYLPVYWLLLGIIFVLTGIFHYSIIQIQEQVAAKFANRFMMISGIKMMIYLILITTYVFINPDKALVFLISFFILYLLYTVFEVFLIVRFFRKKR